MERCAMAGIEERIDLGIALKCEGQYDEALVLFQEIAADHPGQPEVHRQIGLVYGFIGLFDESLQELLTAIQLAPEDIGIRNDLALTYAMLGMTDEAKAEFEAVLVVDPNNEIAKRNMVYF